jgi:hypothetical protein
MIRIAKIFLCGSPTQSRVDAGSAQVLPVPVDHGRGRARSPVAGLPAPIRSGTPGAAPGSRDGPVGPGDAGGFPLSAAEHAEALRLQMRHDAGRPAAPAALMDDTVIAPERALGFPIGDTAFAEAMQLQALYDARHAADAGVAAPSAPPWPSERPRGLGGWAPDATWAATSQAEGAEAFQQFLGRLHGKDGAMAPAEYNNWASRPAFVARVDALLDAMEKSPELRATCLSIAAEATASCGDRIALALNDMEIAHINDDARRGRYDDAALFKLGRGMYRIDVLDKIATDAIARQHASGGKVEPVEIRLAYQTQLASRLDLPGVSHAMLHLSEAHVTPRELDDAAKSVRRQEAATGGLDFLVGWQPWQEAMKRRNPTAFALVQQSIRAQQEAFAVLPGSLPCQVQRALYEGVVAREKTEIENFTKTETVKFLAENEVA